MHSLASPVARRVLAAAAVVAALLPAAGAGAARAVIPAGESYSPSVPFRYGYGVVLRPASRASTVSLPGGVTVPRSWLGS